MKYAGVGLGSQGELGSLWDSTIVASLHFPNIHNTLGYKKNPWLEGLTLKLRASPCMQKKRSRSLTSLASDTQNQVVKSLLCSGTQKPSIATGPEAL